jgi:hypothetical protein
LDKAAKVECYSFYLQRVIVLGLFLDKTAKVERYFFYLQRVIVLRLPFSVKDVLRNLSGTSHLQAGRPKVGAIIFFSYLGRSLCSGCFVKERCTHRERAKCCEYRVDAHYYLQTKPPMNLFLFVFSSRKTLLRMKGGGCGFRIPQALNKGRC